MTDRLRFTLRALGKRICDLLPPRWLLLIIGIGCVIYSQYIMEQQIPLGQPLPLADFWNSVFRLEIVNLSNVLRATPYFIAGLILCAWVGLPSSWKGTFENWHSHWTKLNNTRWGNYLPRLITGTVLMIYLLFKLGKHQYMPIYPVLWIIALWLFTTIIQKWDRDNGVDISPGISAGDVLCLLALFTGGLALGAYALQNIPMIMVPDEGSFWEAARAIAIKEFHPVFFDSGVYSFPVASSIYQGWILRWFGVNFWGWRFSSVVAGTAAVIPLYLLAKEWFGRRAAVASAMMMLANPYFLSFARIGYNNIQALFPVTLSIYFWALGCRKGSYFHLWLAGLTAGLGFYTYPAAWIGIVALCLGIVYLRILKQISWKQSFGVLILILLAWGLAFSPRLAYTSSGELKEGLVYKIFESSFFNVFYGKAYYGDTELLRTRPLIDIGNNQTIFYDPLVYQELLTRGFARTIVALFDPQVVTEHFLISALSGIITPIFFAIGSALFLRRWKQIRFGLPLIWLISGMFFLSMIGAFPPRHTHMVSLIPVMALIGAAGLSAVIDSLAEYLPPRWIAFRPMILNISILVVSLVVLYYGAQGYFVDMPKKYPPPYEDYVSWVAWRTKESFDLIYLGRTDIAHRVEYLVDAMAVPHGYANFDLYTFSPQNDLEPNAPTVIFAETNSKEGLEYLQKPPEGFGAPLAYYDQSGYILGYAMTNSRDVHLEWDSNAIYGLQSLTDTPVRNVLLVLLVIIFVVSVIGLRDRFRWPHISLEAGNQIQETESGKGAEGSDSFEVEFRLRVRFPSRRKNPPQ